MMFNRLRSLLHSVFVKLLLILLGAGVGVNVLVIAFFNYIHHTTHLEPQKKRVVLTMRYIVRDLGVSPSLERALKIAREGGIEIRYEGPGRSWTTSDRLPSIDALHRAVDQSVFADKERLTPPGETGFQVWWMEAGLNVHEMLLGRDYIEIIHGQDRFIGTVAQQYFTPLRWIHLMVSVLITLLTLIMAAAYLAIGRVLHPMKLLAVGVRRVGNGDLDTRVCVNRADELGQMAAAFNDMAERIQDMLTSRQQLLLDVSHELRSPLTRMKVALELLPESRITANLREDVAEMETMVAEILETARLRNRRGRLDVRPVDIAALIRETAAVFEGRPPGVRLNGLPDRALIRADPAQVKTVLKNIISNALKYSEKDGNLIEISLTPHSDGTSIRIADRGVGIPAEELPYIFEPFYRVDKSRARQTGGYGLGLNLCKTIMDAHGGKIEVQSDLGKGTVVTLIFQAVPFSVPE